MSDITSASTVEKQLSIIRRGAVEILIEDELKKNLSQQRTENQKLQI